MITETVLFDMEEGTSREDALKIFRVTAPAWAENQDLIHKYYFFDALTSTGGGVYIWKSLEAANKWHGDDYKRRIKALYGSEVKMMRYDTLLVVDNTANEVFEP